jgi:hypothetical protein
MSTSGKKHNDFGGDVFCRPVTHFVGHHFFNSNRMTMVAPI